MGRGVAVVVAAASMALGLAACGGGDEPLALQAPTTTTPPTEVPWEEQLEDLQRRQEERAAAVTSTTAPPVPTTQPPPPPPEVPEPEPIPESPPPGLDAVTRSVCDSALDTERMILAVSELPGDVAEARERLLAIRARIDQQIDLARDPEFTAANPGLEPGLAAAGEWFGVLAIATSQAGSVEELAQMAEGNPMAAFPEAPERRLVLDWYRETCRGAG